MCCTITSLYLVFPECIGCTQEFECICFEAKGVGCKPVKNNPKLLCILQEGSCNLVPPTTCCKGTTQVFCCDNRCAFPCDADVPCIFNVYGFTCCYKNNCTPKCCVTIKELEAAKGSS